MGSKGSRGWPIGAAGGRGHPHSEPLAYA